MAGSAGVASAAAGGASGTGYVVPAGGTQAIVNDAGAVGASGTGYVMPAGSDEAIVNDAGAVGASGTGYVVPATGTEAIVNDRASAEPDAGSDATLSSTEAAAIGTGAILRSVGQGARRPPSPRTECSGGSERSSAAMPHKSDARV